MNNLHAIEPTLQLRFYLEKRTWERLGKKKKEKEMGEISTKCSTGKYEVLWMPNHLNTEE